MVPHCACASGAGRVLLSSRVKIRIKGEKGVDTSTGSFQNYCLPMVSMNYRRDSVKNVIPAKKAFQKLYNKECFGELLPELREDRHPREGGDPGTLTD